MDTARKHTAFDQKKCGVDVSRTIQAAVSYAEKTAKPDGHWIGELCANPTITAEYVFLHRAVGIGPIPDEKDIVRWLLSEQQNDGSWTIAYQHPGDLSTTAEVYLALKILGLDSKNSAMLAAKEFILQHGGLENVRIFTRFYLACFGLWPWSAVPEMPAELILLPSWSPINIYRFSSWARSTIIPLLIICHHQPVFSLPNGTSKENDFLDELWNNPSNKNVPYAKTLSELALSDWLEGIFTLLDDALSYVGGLRWAFVTRSLARRRCLEWIIEHQESEGDWAGIFPPMHFGVIALLLEGFTIDDAHVQGGLEAIERFAWHDERGKRIQSCISPVWDTVLMSIGLCDANISKDDLGLVKAINWVKSKQILGSKGDWRVYCNGQISGGFSFEYCNRWYPDVDDTAAAVIAFLKQDADSAGAKYVIDAVAWILSMQNQDGGWGAFDKDNDKLWLNKIPFSDMDSLCDPSTADVTGRILEALGILMQRCSFKHALEWGDLLYQIRTCVNAAIAFLAKEQEAHGGWYGRWGVNYVYGSSNILCGLAYWKDHPYTANMISAAVDWLVSVQNNDGGWGECLDSYRDPKLAGQGTSTASQTAWGVMGLLTHLPATHPSIERGVQWLANRFTETEDGGGTWPEEQYTGTGFPNYFYIRYSLYSHYFPLMALGRYADALQGSEWIGQRN